MQLFTYFLSLLSLLSQPDVSSGQAEAVHETTAKAPIRVFATPHQQGSVTIHSVARQTVLFYLFNLEGRLVYQNRLTKNEQQTVAGLATGTYTYQAFRDDEEVKGGHVDIRD